MIAVLEMFDTVQDLARKEQKGYQSASEFSRKLRSQELALLDYFHRLYERDQQIVDYLAPFVKLVDVPIEGGEVTKPDDYAHRIRLGTVVITNVCDGKPVISRYPCHHQNVNEVDEMLVDVIAGPNLDKKRFYHYFEDDKIKTLPAISGAKISMTYLRLPVYGVFAQSLNVVNGEDVFSYNAASSADLQWPMTAFNYILALLLKDLGVEIQDPGLAQYGMALFAEMERRDTPQ